MIHLSESPSTASAIVHSSDDAILGLTIDGIVTAWNPGAARIYGYTAHEMVGHDLSRIMVAELRDVERRRLDRAASGFVSRSVNTPRLRKDGVRILVSSTVFPVRDERQGVAALAAIERDVTRERALEAELLHAKPTEQATTVSAAPSDATILLVDDEEDVRVVIATGLRTLGYSVLEATNGEDALAVAEAHAAPIHLVVSDVVMPEMDGVTLFTRLRQWYPAMRFVLVSGYTSGALSADQLHDGRMLFLPKPFRLDTLCAAAERLLRTR